MGKPKAPAAPDYAAAAKEQGAANVDAALASNYLNQQNQVTPYGNLTYSYNGQGYKLPNGTWIPQTTATTTLSPDQQQLYDQQQALSKSLNNIALQGLDYVGDTAFNPNGLDNLPAQGQAPTTPNLATSLPNRGDLSLGQFTGQPGNVQTNLGTQDLSLGRFTGDPSLQTSYDFSGASQMPKYEDFNSSRDKITEAYMARLQPYIDRDRNALENRLANQGLAPTTAAYGAENDTFNRGVNDQRIAALLAGDQLQQNMFNNAMGLRQQGVGEAISQGNFGNAARQGMFNQGLAAANFNNAAGSQEWQANFGRDMAAANLYNQGQAQRFNQGLAATGFNNDTAAQQWGANNAMDMARAQFGNDAQSQMFNQGLASAQFSQQARQQAMQEAEYLRSYPLNMLNALRTGNQVQMPQFSNVAGGAGIAAAPTYQATADQYAAALNRYNTQMSGWGAMASGLGSIGAAFAPGV